MRDINKSKSIRTQYQAHGIMVSLPGMLTLSLVEKNWFNDVTFKTAKNSLTALRIDIKHHQPVSFD